MGDIVRNPQNARFLLSMTLRLEQCSHMFPMLCLRWAQLGAKLSTKGAKLRHVSADLGLHVHRVASIWNPSGSLWAQLQPNMTNWRAFGAARGQVGTNPSQFCSLSATRSLMGVRVRPCCPHWACLGPNFRARCPPHSTKLRMRAQIVPCWKSVGLKLGPTGPSLAQVSPNLTPVGF